MVDVTWTGPEVPRRWVLPGPVANDWSRLVLEDRSGPVHASVEQTDDGQGLILVLPPHAEPPLHLRYRLAPLPGPGSALRVDADGLAAHGPALLWLPEDESPRDVSLLVSGPPGWDAVTSLGHGRRQTSRLAPSLLQRVDVVAGDLAWAELQSLEGHDHAALLGMARYDFRWVAAETAGVRSSVDDYFLGSSPERFTTIMVVRDRPPLAGPIGVELGPQSMAAIVDDDALWNGTTRLPVAQALVHRWLGGMLTIDMGPDALPGEDVWFTQGFARHVARVVSFELGTLTIDEWLDELHAHEAVLATSSLRDRSNRALVEHASPEAVRVVVARGASYAARLDGLVRARGRSEGLRRVLVTLLRKARLQGRALPLATLEAAIEQYAGPAEVEHFRRQVLQGAPVDIPAGAFGRCFIRGRRRYAQFVLGLDERELQTLQPELQNVDPDGPAHAAGLRPGDRLIHLQLRWGDPSIDVEATVLRGDARVTATWSPRGEVSVGRGWRRDPAVPDQACLLPPP